jgi:hypothetical protein
LLLVSFWRKADLSIYLSNVRFWGAEMPVFCDRGGREADLARGQPASAPGT